MGGRGRQLVLVVRPYPTSSTPPSTVGLVFRFITIWKIQNTVKFWLRTQKIFFKIFEVQKISCLKLFRKHRKICIGIKCFCFFILKWFKGRIIRYFCLLHFTLIIVWSTMSHIPRAKTNSPINKLQTPIFLFINVAKMF